MRICRTESGGTDTGTLGAVVAVVFFVVFVVAGVAFVGGDDGGNGGIDAGADQPEAEGEGAGPEHDGGDGAEAETADGGDGTGTNGDGSDTEEIAVITDSPEIQPYDVEPNASIQPDVSDLNRSEVAAYVLKETNEIRDNNSVGGVRFSEILSEPAREHAVNMSDENYLGHFDPSGEGPEDRYIDECGRHRADGDVSEFEYSENVATVGYKAVFQPTGIDEAALLVTEEGVAEYLVHEWMESREHRENLLGDEWATMGVGIAIDDNGRVFAAQAFCSAGG